MATTPDQRPSIAPIVGPDDPRRFTDSGIEVKPLYTEDDLPANLPERLGRPGEFPFTRGIHERMYRDRQWTMRQYAGYASAKETNERFHYLIDHGSTGLSMAFDLPTQLGRDSDDPLCLGEVGRTGVAIDTIDDMRRVFEGIPLDKVTTSMTINAPAACLLLLYELVGEEQGVESHVLRGTTQNDILKEYIARGNFIFPPVPAMRLTTDLFAYCRERVPKWNTISISGYHMREKGCSAVQEVAFTLADGIAYVQAGIDARLDVDEFGPRLAFFFNGHNNVFQEVAKFRAARRMWARIMRERFGAKDERSLKMRFHTQTGGVTLAAQQPHNNIVRVALQGFAGVCGGTQSLDTNVFDEAENPKEDFIVSVAPDAAFFTRLRFLQLSAYAGADFNYFRTFDQENSVGHTLRGRADILLSRFRPFAAGGRARSRTRPNGEVDTRADRLEEEYSGGLAFDISRYGQLYGAAYRFRTSFRDAFEDGVNLAVTLNRDSNQYSGGLRTDITPLL